MGLSTITILLGVLDTSSKIKKTKVDILVPNNNHFWSIKEHILNRCTQLGKNEEALSANS